MNNLMMVENYIIALREFGAVTIGFIPDVAIGDVLTVSDGRNTKFEPYHVAVVDVTPTTVWLVAVRG